MTHTPVTPVTNPSLLKLKHPKLVIVFYTKLIYNAMSLVNATNNVPYVMLSQSLPQTSLLQIVNQNYVCDVETHDVKISFHIIRQTDKAQIRVSCIDLCTTIPLLAAVLAAGVVCVSEKHKDAKQCCTLCWIVLVRNPQEYQFYAHMISFRTEKGNEERARN